HHSRAEVLQHHVGTRDEAVHHLFRARVLEVERERALTRVQAEEDAADAARRKARVRGHAAAVVARSRLLDLDDVGAKQRELLTGIGAGDHAREGDHAHAVERRQVHGYSGRLSDTGTFSGPRLAPSERSEWDLLGPRRYFWGGVRVRRPSPARPSAPRRRPWCGACRAARPGRSRGPDAWCNDRPTSPDPRPATGVCKRTAAGSRARSGHGAASAPRGEACRGPARRGRRDRASCASIPDAPAPEPAAPTAGPRAPRRRNR